MVMYCCLGRAACCWGRQLFHAGGSSISFLFGWGILMSLVQFTKPVTHPVCESHGAKCDSSDTCPPGKGPPQGPLIDWSYSNGWHSDFVLNWLQSLARWHRRSRRWLLLAASLCSGRMSLCAKAMKPNATARAPVLLKGVLHGDL